MTGMLTAWQRQTDPQRVDTYTRWTIYLLLAGAPLVALSVTSGLTTPAGPVYVALTLAQTVAATGSARRALISLVDRTPLVRSWLVAVAGTSAVAVVVAVVALPLRGEADQPVRALALMLTLTVAVLAVSLGLGPRTVVAAAAAVGLVVAVTELAAGSSGAWFVGALYALVVWGMAVSFRLSGWMLGVVWEQERTRAVHARLAVAEERLRFSRDLHDVVGRTLSAIAVKSELAAELARRGEGDAVAQMLQVRELAQDSLREVRGVVSGLRSADLAAELTGARSVLRSAGIDTRVVGEDARLPEDVQQALAWVVREAVTNVVRHAHARRCTIDLDTIEPDGPGTAQARLTVTNDGVADDGVTDDGLTRDIVGHHGAPAGTDRSGARPRLVETGPVETRPVETRPVETRPVETRPVSRGSGLVGLRERLAEVGGELVTSADGDRFTLRATVPLGGRTGATMAAR